MDLRPGNTILVDQQSAVDAFAAGRFQKFFDGLILDCDAAYEFPRYNTGYEEFRLPASLTIGINLTIAPH